MRVKREVSPGGGLGARMYWIRQGAWRMSMVRGGMAGWRGLRAGLAVGQLEAARRMKVRALTASSMNRKGLAMRSLPPLRVERARLSKSVRLVTNTTGVSRFRGRDRRRVQRSKPLISGISTSRKIRSKRS
jgi:hypothetical protein